MTAAAAYLLSEPCVCGHSYLAHEARCLREGCDCQTFWPDNSLTASSDPEVSS